MSIHSMYKALEKLYIRDARVKLDRGPNFFQVRPEGAGLHFRTEKTKH